MFIPLHTLNDEFLNGARVPLIHTAMPSTVRVEWILDRMVWRDSCLDPGLWEEAALLKRVNRVGLTLDPEDPDVARWCDRKIAEVIVARTGRPYAVIVGAALNIHRKAFVITTIHADGRTYPWMFLRNERAVLVSIPCNDAHISAARAALVRALFGREP